MYKFYNFTVTIKDEDGNLKRKFEFYHITKERFQMELGMLRNGHLIKKEWLERGLVSVDKEELEEQLS